MILKVYSFIYIQNKIIDLLKKALGGCKKKFKIFWKLLAFPISGVTHRKELPVKNLWWTQSKDISR